MHGVDAAARRHARVAARPQGKAQLLLDFVRERGAVHPREVDARFAHGTVTNYWGGSSSATTHLLEHMHYYGLAARRAARGRHSHLRGGTSSTPPPPDAVARRQQIDALVDVVVRNYAPVPGAEPSAPGQPAALRSAAVARRAEGRITAGAAATLEHAHRRRSTGIGRPTSACADAVRARHACDCSRPFDPVVWDRSALRAALGLGLPLRGLHAGAQRKLGYYALPLLWRDRVIGWANVAISERRARCGHRLRRVAAARARLQARIGRRAGAHAPVPGAADNADNIAADDADG